VFTTCISPVILLKGLNMLPWKLFDGASVEHLACDVWVLTVKGRDERPVYVCQNGLGEPIPLMVAGLSPTELRVIADHREKVLKAEL
jgi:hypothetical protein